MAQLATIFDHEAFSLTSLTTGYNSADHIDADVLNMFEVENVEHRNVMIVKAGKSLQVLMPGEIGQHPNIDKHDAESAVPVHLIRYPFDTNIVPDDLSRVASIQDKKIKATELAVLVKSHMTKHKANHRYTSAFTAYTALKGKVKNAKGVVLVDLFKVMGVTERKVNLKLGTAGTDVPKLLKELRKDTMKIAKEHGHLTLKGVECRIGQEFIERILSHASIKTFYSEEIHAKRVVQFADDPSKINICGIEFITDEADAVCEEGASYPKGAKGLFGMLRAPADVMSSSSASNRECHITKEPMKHDEGLEIRSRAIYLPICRDPKLLSGVYSSN
ncbi:major capsid protein [Vibrio europaeus]|uniref:Major capsid protein n=1 Tax=Vibrio europaeus TaxID=300876 RepID=A0ABT5GNC8_9VIBR|nr:major capsid protein [Vibrio europaeus]MDC5723097.1 major capsid protein [Vibrio europaeus]MDC5728054.1 major capsid protein [Vibrio europaeus]MDC5733357.1 major capsid protein [Vibrio europaeus]MDC5738604.1 major capsid protein [Vibrio europaeus]MDC5743834.1 major capsid protein [Vibrio europaeus]